MIIDKRLFDECFCPCNGIARVCLRGDRGIPKELEEIGRDIDKDEYLESCFSIDLIIVNGKAVNGIINYMAVDKFIDCCRCENYEDAWKYYMEHADKDNIKEAIA